MNKTPPLCLAPWNAILVDTDKQVRPCCATQSFFGNLNQNTIQEIISGPNWTDVKTKLSNQEWPDSCQGCRISEESHGWSLRKAFLTYKHLDDCINDEIGYLELNGSNICNLACSHCSPRYSSKWLSEWTALEKDINFLSPSSDKIPKPELFSVDPELILKNLEALDFSKLTHVVFKGGEPFLNNETLIALRYFDKISVLSNIEISVFTNGTIINEEILYFLNKAKEVRINISLDGIGKLNEYIRYGKGSNSEDIRKNIEVFNASIDKLHIQLSVSTMIYNIFNLVEIRDFWLELIDQYKSPPPFFQVIVEHPRYLNVRILPVTVREELIEYYKKNQLLDEFEIVIKALTGESLVDTAHNNWVTYTEKMEKLRGNSIVELVPRLKEFLYYK